MKTSEEMTNDVFRRMEEYETKQKQRRKTLKKTAIGIGCAALVAAGGIGVWQRVEPAQPIIEQDIQMQVTTTTAAITMAVTTPVTTNPVSTGTAPTQTASSTAAAVTSQTWDDLVQINRMAEPEEVTAYFALMCDDHVIMSEDELADYYGVRISPAVPADLTPSDPDASRFIYRREGGTGEVYHDVQQYRFANGDLSRLLTVEAAKTTNLVDYSKLFETGELSRVHNVDVLIGQSGDGSYFAQFRQGEMKYHVFALGLTPDETVAVIAGVRPKANT